MPYTTNEREFVQCKRVCLALQIKESMSDMVKEREYMPCPMRESMSYVINKKEYV